MQKIIYSDKLMENIRIKRRKIGKNMEYIWMRAKCKRILFFFSPSFRLNKWKTKQKNMLLNNKIEKKKEEDIYDTKFKNNFKKKSHR